MQLANTPPLQSTAPGLHAVSIHQTSPLVRGSKHPITAYYSLYRPRKDKRLSRPAWLVICRNKVPHPGVEPRHVTHPSTNRDRRSGRLCQKTKTAAWEHASETWADFRTTEAKTIIFCLLIANFVSTRYSAGGEGTEASPPQEKLDRKICTVSNVDTILL